jgi:hypothetical protein
VNVAVATRDVNPFVTSTGEIAHTITRACGALLAQRMETHHTTSAAGGAISHDGIAFHDRVERRSHDSNPSRAVRGGGETLNARVSPAANHEDTVIAETLHDAWARRGVCRPLSVRAESSRTGQRTD